MSNISNLQNDNVELSNNISDAYSQISTLNSNKADMCDIRTKMISARDYIEDVLWQKLNKLTFVHDHFRGHLQGITFEKECVEPLIASVLKNRDDLNINIDALQAKIDSTDSKISDLKGDISSWQKSINLNDAAIKSLQVSNNSQI